MKYYELWDVDLARPLARYQTEHETLALVRTLVAHYGNAYGTDLSLLVETEDGEVLEMRDGAALVDSANADAQGREDASARPATVVASTLRGPAKIAAGASPNRHPLHVSRPVDQPRRPTPRRGKGHSRSTED